MDYYASFSGRVLSIQYLVLSSAENLTSIRTLTAHYDQMETFIDNSHVKYVAKWFFRFHITHCRRFFIQNLGTRLVDCLIVSYRDLAKSIMSVL